MKSRFIVTLLCALSVKMLFADPLLTSWATAFSGQYARVYTTTANRSSGTSTATWSNQSIPAYADIAQVLYSANWVYVRASDLPSYVAGPWLNPQGVPGQLWPTNQHLINRFPRTPSAQSGTKTISGTGYSGLYVDGIAVFNFTDGKAWNPTNQAAVNGPHNRATYYWHRNAPVGEGFNFDYGLGHQNPGGVYHTHQQPVALRYQLGDHVDFNSSTKNYTESSSTNLAHSPILGWAYDGYPIYGPYGYSVSNDASSGIRRMVSGYVIRDGRNGTDNLTNNLTTIPAWYARFRQAHFGGAYSTTTTQSRPSVGGTNTLGTYAEDYDYYGDLTNPATGQLYVVGTNTFDLDEYNGRWCVTPEYPGGTYAYFLDIDSNGTSVYPYAIAYEYYGVASGGSVSSIAEAVTTNFAGAADTALNLNPPVVDSNEVVTLTWNSTEGGTYQIESSTNATTWTVKKTGVAASAGASTSASYTNDVATGTAYARVTRTALATYDPTGGGSGVIGQTNVVAFAAGNSAPMVVHPVPDQTADYGAGFSCTFASDTFTDSDAGQTLTYSAAGDVLGTASGIAFDGATRTFSATTVDAGDGGTIAGPHTIEVIATDNGSPAMSVTNSFTLTINQAAASVTADSCTRAYGGANPVFTGALSRFVAADAITADYLAVADTNSQAGTWPIIPALNDPHSVLGNYLVTTNDGTLTITQAVLTISAPDVSRSYGSTNPVFSAFYSGFVNGQNFASSGITGAPMLTTSAATNSVVGEYAITTSVNDLASGNYAFAPVDGTLTVTQTALTVTPDNWSRAYGTTNPVLTGTISGVVNNDDISASYSTTAAQDSPVGAYPITATLNDPGARLGNYLVTTNAGILTITNTSTVISINFTGASTNNGTSSPLDASEVAGVLAVANWNNSTNQASGALDHLVDSSGIATPASVTWSADGIGTVAVANNPGDDRMMKGYLDVTDTDTGTVTVANLPDSIAGGSYDVIVYFDGANGSAGRVAKFTLGSATIVGKDNTSFSGGYIQATNTSDETYNTLADNFVLFTNVTGSSFTVSTTPGWASDGNPHAEFNGLQIVAGSAARTAVTTNPASETVCDGDPVLFSAAAQSASVLSVQWQVKTNGGSSFTDIPDATNTDLALPAGLADNGNQYQATFTGSMGAATTTAATLNVSAVPVATITMASTNVIADSTGNTAAGAAGEASYAWSIVNGTITSGAHSQTVTYTAGVSGHVTLGLTVANAGGCTDSNSVDVPIVRLSAGMQTVNHFDSVISLATNLTKDYTFTDPSNGLSVVVAVTMTPYSSSNASPVFKLLDYSGEFPTHLGVDSGLSSGDGNWVDDFEGVNFSASLVSASTGIFTNSIQFGITGMGVRPDGLAALDWTSSATTGSVTATNESLSALDTKTASLAGAMYSGQLRIVGDGQQYQISDAGALAGQSIVLQATFYEGTGPVATPSVGTFSLGNGQFQFLVNGTTGAVYVVEAATNLASPVWLPIITNPAPFIFEESNLDLYPQRFYRAVTP
jgi:hypothetical protein